jgi:Helix-turn-helix domain
MRALIERYGLSVSIDVAASIVGFSDDKVRELRRAGRFPGHRAGTKVMVFVPELVEWIRNGGEAQYDPPPAESGYHAHALRPRRSADRPAWMDRVRAAPPAEH